MLELKKLNYETKFAFSGLYFTNISQFKIRIRITINFALKIIMYFQHLISDLSL